MELGFKHSIHSLPHIAFLCVDVHMYTILSAYLFILVEEGLLKKK